jgi:ectoine hydroxylase-related dioxygenase (phytanoyl-CoA dioxygenase family)
MGLTDAERFVFDLRGFIVLRQVLDADVVHEMCELLDARGLATATEEERGKIEAIFDWGQPFLDLIDHPRTLPFVTELVDEAPRLDNAYAVYMIPGDHGLPLHAGVADGKTTRVPTTTTWYGVEGGRISSGLTKVCWALSDVPPGSGGFCVVPGSHKASFPPPSHDTRAEVEAGHAVEVTVSAGDAIVFTEALVHGSLDWTGPGPRRVLVYKYTPGYVRYFGQEWLDGTLDKLTDRQRALVAPPYVRDERHEKRQPIR